MLALHLRGVQEETATTKLGNPEVLVVHSHTRWLSHKCLHLTAQKCWGLGLHVKASQNALDGGQGTAS